MITGGQRRVEIQDVQDAAMHPLASVFIYLLCMGRVKHLSLMSNCGEVT